MTRPSTARLSILALSLSLAACASGPVKEIAKPLLQLDPLMHTAPISALATDDAGSFVVTASHDKTARLWARNGDLLATLRPPAGDGEEGALHAVAASPDGHLIAVGGWTQLNQGARSIGSEGISVHIFERSSGRLIRRIGGLPNIVVALAFAADNRRLAVGLAGEQGLRVFDASDGSAQGDDDGIKGFVGALRWHGKRLAATSYDGKVRLYEHDGKRLQKIAEVAAPGGKRPLGLSFSPDGKRLAVGHDDSTTVAVLDGATLSPLFNADTGGITYGNLAQVDWSRDGQRLFASGRAEGEFDGKFRRLLRSWAGAGEGAATMLPAAEQTVTALASLADGAIAVGATTPSVGEIAGDGKLHYQHGSPVRDFRNLVAGPLIVSNDGLQVHIGNLRFSLANRAYDEQDMASPLSPRTSAFGFKIEQWENKETLQVGDKPLKLRAGELARSVAVAMDGKSLAIGTDWALRRVNRAGEEVWQKRAGSPVLALNLAAMAQILVAAHADGTIRWYRYQDGRELLALYAHPDNRRWLVWTPAAYFDASPGGADLVGVQINRGAEREADFFPLSRFRASHYRPDVIDFVLGTLDDTEAYKQAEEEAGRKNRLPVRFDDLPQRTPPVLDALPDNAPGARKVFRFKLRTPDEAPAVVKLRLNGRPLATEGPNGVNLQEGLEDVWTLALPTQLRGQLAVYADNRFGASTPRYFTLGDGKAVAASKPDLHVLAVGVSRYTQDNLRLTLAANDARDVAEVVRRQQGGSVGAVNVKLLTDEQATREAVIDGFEWLRRQVKAGDLVVLYLAGQAFNDVDGGFYFLPVDGDANRIRRAGISFAEIRLALSPLPAQPILFADVARAGESMSFGYKRRGQADLNALANDLGNAENGVAVFASTTGRQLAQEKAGDANGVFAKALIEGLNGKAADARGVVDLGGLDRYLADRVRELTTGQQTPRAVLPPALAPQALAKRP